MVCQQFISTKNSNNHNTNAYTHIHKYCSKFPPSCRIHNLARFVKFVLMPSNWFLLIDANAVTILLFSSFRSPTGALYTRSFTVPHSEKSRGVRSGERGGQRIGPFAPIQVSNIWSIYSVMRAVLCGGAPSCWYIKFLLVASGIVSRIVGICSINISWYLWEVNVPS